MIKPPRNRITVSFRIDLETVRAIDMLAERDHRSRTGQMRQILRQYVKAQTKKLAPWDMSRPRRGRKLV